MKVMLLEDREEDALLVLHELERAGFDPDWRRVDNEADFSKALDASLDVILADYHLPGWSGVAALAMVQGRGLDIPFIIVSGTIGEDTAVDAMRRGAADYLIKDRLARLGPAVRDQLERKRLREENRASEAARSAERQRSEEALRESEARFRSIVQSLPAAIYTCDTEGHVMLWNEAAVALWGRVPEAGKDLWCGSWKIYEPDGRPIPIDECPMAVTMREGQPVRGREIIVERPDGGRFNVLPYPDVIRDSSGAMTGAINMLVDITDRRNAEEALRLSEKKYHDIIEFAPIGFCRAVGGRFAIVNQKLLEMLGHEPSKPSEGPPVVLTPDQIYESPEERQRFLTFVEKNGSIASLEARIKQKDGSSRWVEVNARSLRDADGRMTGVEAFVTDIEDRKRSELALIESEERYRAVVEGAEELIYTISPEGVLTSVNSAFETLTGWSAHELIGQPFWPLLHESERELAEQAWKSLLAGNAVPTADIRLNTRDGGVRIFRAASTPTVKAGRIVQISGIGRDVTDERNTEREKENLARRLQMVLESTDEGLYAVDLSGTCIMVNSSANRLLGYAPGELLGRQMHTVMHHTRADGHPHSIGECAIYQAIRTGQTVRNTDELFWTKSGPSFPVEVASSPIFERDVLIGAVVTFTDITIRRALEGRLERANRLTSLGRLTATIAHEFNNVLMGIQPFAEVIARNVAHQENLAKAAGHISSSVKRGKRITQEILRFTQPAQPILQPIDVQAWLRDLETEARSLLPRTVTLLVEDVSPGLRLLGDSSQLHQILVNLLLNGRDAMPHGGHLTVSAAVEGDAAVYPFGYIEHPSRYVRVTVSDTGDGMSSETMRHVFEPLFTTKPAGTGLGLAVAYQIIKHHEGEIFVESKEGVGTSFHLFIPRATGEQEAMPTALEKLEKPSRCTRLLLVEDDETVSEGLVSILELEGFQVDSAEKGALAAEAVRRFAPDAVILDVGLPDMSGIDVYLQLSMTWPELPVIFSTGEGDLTKLEPLLQRGNVDYLLKPYRIEVLLDRLSRLLVPPQLLAREGPSQIASEV